MSDENTDNNSDPTFLVQDAIALRTPLGQHKNDHKKETLTKEPPTEGRVKEPRLSRKELEELLDNYYSIVDDEDDLFEEQDQRNHAKLAGSRMLRNMAFVASCALFFGFGLGLYSLVQQGGETRIGQTFNQTVAGLIEFIGPSFNQQKDHRVAWSKSSLSKAPATKPVKTASLVVADASGTILAGIPLKLSLKSDADASLLQVKILNVPHDAVLTAGSKRKDGVWILQPSDLNGVSLVVSADRKSPLKLEVELVETQTGELLSPTREIKVAILGPERFKVRGL